MFPHFCLTNCVGWIHGLFFYFFGHSCLHRWWELCVSGCYEQGRIACYKRLYLFLPSARQDLTQGQWPEGRLKVGIVEGKGSLGMSRESNPAGLCQSSAHLVQCEPDEPSWTWTQTWVQAQMPDYSLNWTTRSSAILAGQWPLHAQPAKCYRRWWGLFLH